MNFTPIITILLAAVVIYFFVKLIVNPLIKVIVGLLVFIIILYVLRRFFNFDFESAFGPFGQYLDPEKWGVNIYGIFNSIEDYIKNIIFRQ